MADFRRPYGGNNAGRYPSGQSSRGVIQGSSSSHRQGASTSRSHHSASVIPLEDQHRMDEASRTLWSWEDLAVKAINSNESLPRTRFRLRRLLATPYNPDPNASTVPNSDMYRNEIGVAWEDYERRTRDAYEKSQAKKERERAESRSSRSRPPRASYSAAGSSVADNSRSGAKRKGKASTYELDDDQGNPMTGRISLDLEDDEMELDDIGTAPGRRTSGQKRKASGGRRG